ncbi:MAG: hypothetical protein IPL40_10290 [Proteobacteria bacterium]|nr:hypothetical protein [Pseudomonadota bacterium]
MATLALGQTHTCARLTNGTVRCWGYNASGRLGDGSTTNSSTPVTVLGLSNASTLALGNAHSCARLTNGTLRCWGYNASGQLGDGTTTSRETPVAVAQLSRVTAVAAGVYHTCAQLSTGLLRCWGQGANGQLGTAAFGTMALTPAAPSMCGDGVCEFAEKLFGSCAADCTPLLGDCVCDPLLEDLSNSPADCDPNRSCQPRLQCNDGHCDTAAGETCKSCSGANTDCGPCA